MPVAASDRAKHGVPAPSLVDVVELLYKELEDDEDLKTIGIWPFLEEARNATALLESSRDSIAAWPHIPVDSTGKNMKKRDAVMSVAQNFTKAHDAIVDFNNSLTRVKRDRIQSTKNLTRRVEWKFKNIVNQFRETNKDIPLSVAEGFATIDAWRFSFFPTTPCVLIHTGPILCDRASLSLLVLLPVRGENYDKFNSIQFQPN